MMRSAAGRLSIWLPLPGCAVPLRKFSPSATAPAKARHYFYEGPGLQSGHAQHSVERDRPRMVPNGHGRKKVIEQDKESCWPAYLWAALAGARSEGAAIFLAPMRQIRTGHSWVEWRQSA